MKKTHLLLGSIGFAGALPLPLIGSVLSLRLKESGFDIVTIGLLSLFHFPFALKPFFAPLIERLSAPFPFHRHERREGWLLFSLLLTFFALSIVAFFPAHPLAIVSLSCTSGLLYLTGLQVEISLAPITGQMKASASVISGYRIGLLTAGAGTLLMAEGFGWELSYLAVALLLFIPFLFKTSLPPLKETKEPLSFLNPLKDLMKKGIPFFLFLFFYRLGDDLADPMLRPYFLDIGFQKVEIAQFGKILGMGASLLGVATAGWSKGLSYPLFIFGGIHALSFLSFAFLTHSTFSLASSVFLEHFSSGLIITAFIATLWREVTPAYATTQYALLWSLLSLKRSLVGSLSGFLATSLGWPIFFSLIATLSLLGAILSIPLQLTSDRPLSKMKGLLMR